MEPAKTKAGARGTIGAVIRNGPSPPGAATHSTSGAPACTEVVTNKAGQKLGRKGLETRARILASTKALLSEAAAPKLTPSTIMRHAALASQSFYLYFDDVEEVLLTLCEETIAEVPPLIELIRCAARTGDEAEMRTFVRAYNTFARRHFALFALRNFHSDAGDLRFFEVRARCALPVIETIVDHMIAKSGLSRDVATARAVIVIAGMDRLSSRPAVPEVDHAMSDATLWQAEADVLAMLMEFSGFRA